MPEPVANRVTDGVAVITIDNPPVNALSAPVRAGLAAALSEAETSASVRVIVLAARGRSWPVGADIHEFDKPPVGPPLSEICTAIALCPKPVLAALHGTALGGGLELALVADYRLAAAGTRLGFPEVSLGLLPGAGGTQRLPRLIGPKAALGMMLSGLPMLARRGVELGLIDEVVTGDVAVAAEELAQKVVSGLRRLRPGPRPDRLREDPAQSLAAIADARKGLLGRRLPAPVRIIDCVEAALLLPEEEGAAYEAVAFGDLVESSQSAALRHAFIAERRAGHPPELEGVLPRPVAQVGVIGAGPEGTAATLMLLAAGYSVILFDRVTGTLAEGLERIATAHEMAVAAGTLSPEQREEAWDRVSGAASLAGLAACDLVIEATDLDEPGVARLFAELERELRPSTVLATTHGGIDIDRLAGAGSRADDVIGVYFHDYQANKRLVEIVTGTATAPAVTATILALVRKTGKLAVRARSGAGMISQRLMRAYHLMAEALMEAGASPYDIDRAMVSFGFRHGPCQALDLEGLEGSAGGVPGGSAPPTIRQRLVAAGRLGRDSGRGFYRYDETGRGAEDPEVLELIESVRRDKGIAARSVSGREIRHRAVAAMANEGARLLGEGVASCPLDIDLVMLAGFGFPRWRGGPMQTADQAGLLRIRNDLRDYAREDADFWQPADLWDDLIKNGRKFADLNGG